MAAYQMVRAFNPRTGRYEMFRQEIEADTIDRPYDPQVAQRMGLKTERGYRNRMQRKYDAGIRELQAIEDAPEIESADISIKWRGGSNGHQATATVDYYYTESDGRRYHGTAHGGPTRGWGYDKGSTALADAFNSDPALQRIAYEAASDGRITEDWGAASRRNGRVRWNGGIGISGYRYDVPKYGYDFETVYADDDTEVYTMRRKTVSKALKTGGRKGPGLSGIFRKGHRCSSTASTATPSAPTTAEGPTASATSSSMAGGRTTARPDRTSATV